MTLEGLGPTVPAEQFGLMTGPERLDDEILYAPVALRGIAADIGRRHQSREGDYFLTPAINIEDDQLVVNALVRIGYLHYESDQTIFAVDDNKMRPWYRIAAEEITMGDGEQVDSLDERKRVAAILRLTGTALDETVIDDLQGFEPSDLFEKGLIEQIATLENRIDAMLTRLASFQERLETDTERPPKPPKTVITIQSGWAREGEESPTTEYDSDVALTDALKHATDNFKIVNKRSDVQGTPSIYLRHGEAQVAVPAEVWQDYFQMISGSSGIYEQMGLKYAQTARERQQPS